MPKWLTFCRVKYDKYIHHKPPGSQAQSVVGQELTWCDALSGRLAAWGPYDEGETCVMLFMLCSCRQCLYSLCTVQVAGKRLNTSNAPASAESLFLKKIQSLRLVLSSHWACRMLGVCELDRDACILKTLYSKSAAHWLKEVQGLFAAVYMCSSCLTLYHAHQTGLLGKFVEQEAFTVRTHAVIPKEQFFSGLLVGF